RPDDGRCGERRRADRLRRLRKRLSHLRPGEPVDHARSLQRRDEGAGPLPRPSPCWWRHGARRGSSQNPLRYVLKEAIMRDLHNNLGLSIALPAAEYDADNTPAAIDLLGFESALIAISVGVGGITFSGTNKIEFKLTHSDDDSDYSAVTVDDVQGL